MLRLAVTGGIASGKSTVLQALAALGVPTLDLDLLCRRAVEPGRPALSHIRAEFGEELVPGGRLDRAGMRDLISRDPEARKRLEAIIHPVAREETERWLAGLAAQGEAIAAVEVPLLYEVGWEGVFQAVIVAACPEEVALQRLVGRSGLGPEEGARLMAAQMPLEEKTRLADFVVDTAGSRQEVARQVERILQKVMQDPKRKA